MGEMIVIDALSQLTQFMNEKGVIEIFVRGKKQRCKAIHKIMIDNLQEANGEKAKALMEKVIQSISKQTEVSEKNFDLLKNVIQSQNLGLILNGLNLCATCVGFAIMYEKLDRMGTEINRQIGKLQNMAKQTTDIQTGYEFNKVLADHTDMLDSRRRQRPYDEQQLRDLVDREYNVLMLLIEVLKCDLADDRKMIIETAVSLLSMMTVSLCYFDELYYFNNREVLANEDPWHSSHEKWMGAYNRLLEEWFVELLQDYGAFETDLTTVGIDMYYSSILDQISDSKQKVEDNQMLIITIGDIGVLHNLQEQMRKETQDILTTAITAAFQDTEDFDALNVRDEALRQVALM